MPQFNRRFLFKINKTQNMTVPVCVYEKFNKRKKSSNFHEKSLQIEKMPLKIFL